MLVYITNELGRIHIADEDKCLFCHQYCNFLDVSSHKIHFHPPEIQKFN